jgi:hypothetical protein
MLERREETDASPPLRGTCIINKTITLRPSSHMALEVLFMAVNRRSSVSADLLEASMNGAEGAVACVEA